MAILLEIDDEREQQRLSSSRHADSASQSPHASDAQ
jgi:hypothetical protein